MSEVTPRPSLKAIAHGRVQGVGYRMFVYQRARALGLVGSVRNLPGGQVEVYAAGEASALETLLAQMKEGPAFARVDEVAVSRDVPVSPDDDFIVQF